MKNILNKLKWFFNSLMFSLRKVDVELLSQNNDSSDINSGIHQEVNNGRVAHHLLKGEVTQEVVELRYRDYTIADEARNFKYIGNGKTIKSEKNTNVSKFKVVNRNKTLSILDSISFEKKYENVYTLDIEYNVIPRFKFEKSCTILDVNMDDNTIIFHFLKHSNVYNQDKPFKNELKRLLENNSNLSRHDFNEISSIKFVTFEIKGVKNYLSYHLSDFKILSVEENNDEYLLKYQFENCSITDLTIDFFSEEMALKYANKEPKLKNHCISANDKHEKCEICGKILDNYLDQEPCIKDLTNKTMCYQCLLEIGTEQINKIIKNT